MRPPKVSGAARAFSAIISAIPSREPFVLALRFLRLLPPLALLISASWAVERMQPDAALIEQLRLRHGAAAAQRVHTWGELMRQLPAADEAEKLTRVNRFFNRIPQGDDLSLWGLRDYWASPLELLVKNAGDCEDFAIAKYFTLVAGGVAEEKLRITYARAWLPREKRVEAHMVLAYYPTVDGDPLILDNLVDEIVPAPLRADLTPTHSFNAAGLWSARQRGQSGRLGDTASVKRWSELLDRMHKERP